MIHLEFFPAALAVAILVAAAAIDIRTFRISNRICLAILCTLCLAWVVGGRHPSAPSSAIAFAATFACFGALWVLGRRSRAMSFGGGDWKLLSALSPWAGLGHLMDLLLVTALAGGVLTLATVAARVAVPAGSPLRTGRWFGPVLAASGVPYGVAIAGGGIAVILGISAL